MSNASPQFVSALRILGTLREAGYEAYLAGGCVRDLLLGREPSDYDVATSATPDIVLDMFPRTFSVGAHFGVVLVAAEPEDSSEGSAPPQVRRWRWRRFDRTALTRMAAIPTTSATRAAPRKTSSAATSPSTACCSTGCGPETFGERPEALRTATIDHVGGLADLDAGMVRAIGEPARRFQEDQLRLLRAVRFAARFGFTIEPETFAAMRALAPRIHAVSRERVRDELTKMLTGAAPAAPLSCSMRPDSSPRFFPRSRA